MSIVFWKMSIVLEKISHVFSKTMDFFVLTETANVAKKKDGNVLFVAINS